MQQIGHWAAQANFDNAPGHGPNFGYRFKIKAKRCPGKRTNRWAQRIRRRFAGQLAPVRPVSLPQSENIALTIISHDPAISQGWDNLAILIETDQPFCNSSADMLGRRGEPHTFGEQPTFTSDQCNLDRSAFRLATGKQQGSYHQKQCCAKGLKHVPSRRARFARLQWTVADRVRPCEIYPGYWEGGSNQTAAKCGANARHNRR